MESSYSSTDLALILGVSARAVRKRAEKDVWAFTESTTGNGGKPEKRYPAPDLPEDVRIAILKHESEAPALVPYNKDIVHAPPGSKALTLQVNNSCGLSSDQKKRALFRADLVRLYLQRLKKATRGGKQLAREQFDLAYNSGTAYPDIFAVVGRTNWKTIERWKILLRRSKDPYILADERGQGRRGKGLISDEQAAVLIPLICNPNKLCITTIIRKAKSILAERRIDNGFSEDTYRRYINAWRAVNFDKVVFFQEGEHGIDEQVLPYLRRDWSLIEVGDVLVADGHVLNGEAINPETGKPKRMTSIWWYDMASNYPVGWEIMPTENTQAIASSLRRAILRLGKIPKVLYLDNGRAFRAKFFEGSPDFRQSGLTGLFERLGCKCVHAWPHHAQSKPIERFFGTFAELERLSPSFVGTNINDKPPHLRRGEHLHRRLHQKLTGGQVPTIEGWHRAIAAWVDDYASRPQKRTHLKGATPAEVFEAGRGPGVDRATLHDMLLHERRTVVGRNGVTIRIDGQPTDFYDRELYGRRHSVIVRFDPVGLALGDADSVLVYSPEGRELICEAQRLDQVHPMAEILGTQADVIDLGKNIELKRSLKKETIGSAREFVESEVLPEVRRDTAWSMAKVGEASGVRRGEKKLSPKDVERLLEPQVTQEDLDRVASDLAESRKIRDEMEARYAAHQEPEWLDLPPDRDMYAKTFWETVEELPEMDRYERLLECEAHSMVIPKQLAAFMRYFTESSRYALLKDYFEERKLFFAANVAAGLGIVEK